MRAFVDSEKNSEDAPHATRPPGKIILGIVDSEKYSKGAPRASQCRRPPKSETLVDSKKNSEDAQSTQNYERVVNSESYFEDAPHASAAARPKTVGRRLRAEFSGCSTRQRCHPPKTTRGLSFPTRILRTLHAPAPPPAQNHEMVVDSEKYSEEAPHARARGRQFRTLILKTLHVPAPSPTQIHEKVVDSERERFDTHGTCSGFAIHVENSHGLQWPTASESILTRTKPAQGSPTTLKICTAPLQSVSTHTKPRRELVRRALEVAWRNTECFDMRETQRAGRRR